MTEENTDNVVPLLPTHGCSSCGAMVHHDDRFRLDAHNEGCMQPEIRMKRMERELAQVKEVMYQLVASNNETVTNQVDLNRRLVALEEPNGTSESTPDTQRSGALADPNHWSGTRPIDVAEAADPSEPRSDTGAAEPGCSEAAGAVPSGEGSEWPGRSGCGSQCPPEGGDRE